MPRTPSTPSSFFRRYSSDHAFLLSSQTKKSTSFATKNKQQCTPLLLRSIVERSSLNCKRNEKHNSKTTKRFGRVMGLLYSNDMGKLAILHHRSWCFACRCRMSHPRTPSLVLIFLGHEASEWTWKRIGEQVMKISFVT